MIATSATLAAFVAARMPGLRDWVTAIDNSYYDAVYRLRPAGHVADSPVVVLGIDQQSLDEVAATTTFTWPWPRGYWAFVAEKLHKMGARAMVLDMLLSERGPYGIDDEEALASGLDRLEMPFVSGVVGVNGKFSPPVTKPVILGDTGIDLERVYRKYRVTTARGDSLALAGVKAAGYTPKLDPFTPFRLHFYGPHRDDSGRAPFPAYSVGSLITQIAFERDGTPLPIEKQFDPALVKGKIVIIGPLAGALHDMKRTPVSEDYPGVEVHATAMINLIRGEQVRPVPIVWIVLISWLSAICITFGVVLYRMTWLKITCIFVVMTGLVLWAGGLMSAEVMWWFPPTTPLVTAMLATVGSLLWVYKIEDARARALLKVLSQCISPEVASDLAADPTPLAVGGQKRDMSILFTDLQGFTDLTERLQEGIEPVLNLYLAEMSQQAFDRRGTIDKYIGDAMMVFWNAPLTQPDHARIACETALALVAHEKRIAPQMAELGANHVFTRIGIHTGPVVVGFFGSKDRLTYTAVGDSVNLAARLEPANKGYGTQIMVSEDTMKACQDTMLFRPLDRLRVYGRKAPVGIYELIAGKTEATEDQRWIAKKSDEAGQLYLTRHWPACLTVIEQILQRFPHDPPSAVWRERVELYMKNPPPADWDGVWELTSK